MRKSKTFSLLVSAVMACMTLLIPEYVSAATINSAAAGSIVEFGSYYNKPIQYKIGGTRDVDGDGQNEVFLYSKDIISFKEYSPDGVADWRKASLRKWLNSLDAVVEYDSENTPSYASQPGFMSWFTDSELSVMVPVTQKTLINKDLSPDGGQNGIGWTDTWPGCYTNAVGDRDINTAYYVMTTDTVFIPSITDMYDYSMPLHTSMTVVDAASLEAAGETAAKEKVMVRDGQDTAKIRSWYPFNSISVTGAEEPLMIRPCFYIEGGLEFTGSGTAEAPYKVIVPENVTDISLYQDTTECEWQDGSLTVKITLSDSFTAQSVTAYAVRYEKTEDKLIAADIQVVNVDAVAGDTISIPVTVSNSDSSYMKVFVTDSNNKALSRAENFGDEPAAVATSTTGDASFYVDEPVTQGTDIKITGADKSRAYARVTVIVKKDNEVLYADQKKVDKNNGFCFSFDGENAFLNGVKTLAGGWYTATVTSDFSDTVLTKQVGVASEAVFDDVLDMVNNGEESDFTKVLEKDNAFLLEYNALLGKDLYLDEITANAKEAAVAAHLVAGKPEGGYTEENFKGLFNKAVAEVIFDAATADEKFLMIENDKYKDILGTSTLVQSEAYGIVKTCSAKNSIFDGLTATDISSKLGEKIVIMAANNVQNATDMCSVVEENAGVIGITLPVDYTSLSALSLKALYDTMLGKSYADYAGIKTAFDAGYQAVKSSLTRPSTSGGGGSSSGRGGSSFAAAVTKPTEIQAPDIQDDKKYDTFADVEGLTWGKEEITYLAEAGVISGLTKDTFAPDEAVTREQLCRMIAIAYSISGTGDMPFGDVEEGAWYASSVGALYAGGYISGIKEGEFGVGIKITRQDLAAILYRVIKDKLTNEQPAKDFSDADIISEYAKAAVDAMAASGIISGYDDNSFGAKREVTRREAAVMLFRTLKLGK